MNRDGDGDGDGDFSGCSMYGHAHMMNDNTSFRGGGILVGTRNGFIIILVLA